MRGGESRGGCIGQDHREHGRRARRDEHRLREREEVPQGDERPDRRDRQVSLPEGRAPQEGRGERGGGHRDHDRGSEQAGEMRQLGRVHPERRRDEERSPGAEEHQREEHRERPEAGHGSNRYPMPQTVTRCRGSEGSSSIFSRSRRMCTVTVDESPSQA